MQLRTEDDRRTNIVCPETGKFLILWGKACYDYGEYSPEGHPEITYCFSAWGCQWWNKKTNEYYYQITVPGTGKDALLPCSIFKEKEPAEKPRALLQKLWDKIYWWCYGKWIFQKKTKESYGTFALPLVRQVFPQIIAKDFVEIQPMSKPTGTIYYTGHKKPKKSKRRKK